MIGSAVSFEVMKIAIVHYTSWPVIGGVESVIRQHALLMSRHGHEVAIVCGEGGAFDHQIQTIAFPRTPFPGILGPSGPGRSLQWPARASLLSPAWRRCKSSSNRSSTNSTV